jgi:hypothetical protein
MTRHEAALAIVVALASGQSPKPSDSQPRKRLDWTGACVVDIVHIPCRTVRFHESSFGWKHFEGWMRSESVEAVNSDGTQSNTRSTQWWRFYLFPRQTRKITELVLRDRTVFIDREQHAYEIHSGDPHRSQAYWVEDDPQCSFAKSRRGPFSARMPDSTIAGFSVIGYRGQDAKGVDYEAYFAPSIGCEMMLFREVARGILGWKTAEYERVVDSYEIGPPSKSLFTIPNGFKLVTSI